MNNLVFSLNITVPVFLVIVLGIIFKKLKLFDDHFTNVANKFVFNVCLPIMIFSDMAKTNIESTFNGKLVAYSAIITIVMFSLIWLGAKLFIKDKSIIGAFVQASFRSSVAVMGFAFMINLYGNTGFMPMIIIGCVPLYNIFSVVVLTFEAPDAQNDKDKLRKFKKAAFNIITNPIILGILFGCLGSLIQIFDYIPTIGERVLDNISALTTPLSLLVIGASIKASEALSRIKPTLVCSFIKLVIIPAVFISIAIALGFRDKPLIALVFMLGSPTTPSCFIMAKNMKNDSALTANVIATTTLLSSVTLTFWIYIVKTLEYIS